MNDVAPGWYPDPTGRFETRFHNGVTWTADVANNGQRFVDPLGTAPPRTTTSANGGGNRQATAAMVLGIVALAIAWMPFVVIFGVVSAVLALVLGTVGLRRSSTSGTGRAFALTGLITGAVGLLACVVGVLLTVVVIDTIDRFENPPPHEATITSCELDGSTATLTAEITNLGNSTADFSVKIAFVRPGTDNAQHSTRVAVDNVPPGGSAEFGVDRRVALDEIDCIISSIDGPLPFGLELD